MTNVLTFTKTPNAGEPWDVAIIGSGPSAFTAAIYTSRGALSTLILGGDMWGGQLMLTTEVDNFPAHPGIMGPELMTKMKDHALLFGAKMIEKNVTSFEVPSINNKYFKLTTADDLYLAKSVIIATGADTSWLGVPGEDKLRGRGVSSCAPCDAPFFKDKKVAVVGGGDSAMEEALVLTKYASEVVLIHRRDSFRASAAMQKRVFENKKIQVLWDSSVAEILGDEKVTGLKIKTTAGTKQAQKVKGEEKQGFVYWNMDIDGIFVAIGHTPSTKIFKDKVELDTKGFIVKKSADGFNTLTSQKGVFVAGDVHDYHYKQAITAAGFGCMAGMDTVKYLADQN
ncbi:FAD-dependent oxidoreductase [Candidatus Woesebacteria bacterium]|nr:MAG: FAD-dependent oxidoreductase [Candidatus Woesebacteria bacterium]